MAGANLRQEVFAQKMIFPEVCLVHGLGGSPNGSVKELEKELLQLGRRQPYVRPLMPHSDMKITSVMPSVAHLETLGLPQGTLVVGVSMGGLVASRLQESSRPDLHVICINAPTWAGDVELEQRVERRYSFYSSTDEVIAGRIARWPSLAEAYDLPWLTGHDTDPCKRQLAAIIDAYMESGRIDPKLLTESF